MVLDASCVRARCRPREDSPARRTIRALALATLVGTPALRALAGDGAVTCPGTPRDGASCADVAVGTSCRYRRRGVVCECQRADVDGRHRRIWVCGEAGE